MVFPCSCNAIAGCADLLGLDYSLPADLWDLIARATWDRCGLRDCQ